MIKNKKSLNLYLDKDLQEKLIRVSKNTGINRSNLVTIALNELFSKENLKDEGINLNLDTRIRSQKCR